MKQYKYYALAAIGAAWAAAVDSLILLALTTAITIYLMQMEKRA
jgi:hypothetical protein